MKSVVLYGLSTCPWCRKAKEFFSDRSVPLEYTNYDQVDEDRQNEMVEKMRAAGGEVTFPFAWIGEDAVIGWKPHQYKQLLDLPADKAA